jgi:rod shape-determining protein MreD
MAQDQNRIWVIWLSLLAAMLLTIVPIPTAIEVYRPQWLALFLIYWAIALPQRISVGHGFLFGLLLDVLTGTTMGENAFSLSLITFIAHQGHARLRTFPFSKQAFAVIGLLLIQKAVSFIAIGMTLGITTQNDFWLTPLIGAALWPSIFFLLRKTRRRMRVR